MTTRQIRDQEILATDAELVKKDTPPARSSIEEKITVSRPEDLTFSPDPAPPAKWWKWVLVISSILSSTYLFALGNSIVADIQPAIVEQFHNVKKVLWISVAFSLGDASTCLVRLTHPAIFFFLSFPPSQFQNSGTPLGYYQLKQV